jgi:predicted dehydrogenase
MRIGVVGAHGGTDRWGARTHLPAIAALEEAELVAVCTAREETAKRAQQRTGARLAFWDYEEMVRAPEIDLVTVAVRIGLHHPIVLGGGRLAPCLTGGGEAWMGFLQKHDAGSTRSRRRYAW